MRYAMLLKSHSNARYVQSLQKLAIGELSCALAAWDIPASPSFCDVLGETFLTFEADAIPDTCWRDISSLSSICLAGELHGDELRVLKRDNASYLPPELPHLLKYKGKTNADFTALMLHCARDASTYARTRDPLTVLDPLCGKATTLFGALCRGDNAIGVESDEKALREADQFFAKCLQLHKLKHSREQGSRTLSGGGNARVIKYVVADSAERWKAGDTRSLTLICGDARRLAELVKPDCCHLIVTDLPYGVQHAPQEGQRMSSLDRLAQALMPGCMAALKPGGAAAFSFNAYTLRKDALADAATAAGLTPLIDRPFDDFSHWVEQAVERDILFARNNA